MSVPSPSPSKISNLTKNSPTREMRTPLCARRVPSLERASVVRQESVLSSIRQRARARHSSRELTKRPKKETPVIHAIRFSADGHSKRQQTKKHAFFSKRMKIRIIFGNSCNAFDEVKHRRPSCDARRRGGGGALAGRPPRTTRAAGRRPPRGRRPAGPRRSAARRACLPPTPPPATPNAKGGGVLAGRP